MNGLRKPFPPELIGKLPGSAKRPALDYVGHAAVTDRLNQCAPGWEFVVLDRFDTGDSSWVHARMAIDGVSRDEYGEGDDPKKAISDALKRCAMRWGVALDLWSKEDLSSGGPSPRGGGGTTNDPKPPIRAGGTSDGGRLQPVKAADASPVPSAPPAPSQPGQVVGKGIPADRSEGGADSTTGVEGSVSPKDCKHEHTSPLRPDGSEMPINRLRCLDCGKAVNIS